MSAARLAKPSGAARESRFDISELQQRDGPRWLTAAPGAQHAAAELQEQMRLLEIEDPAAAARAQLEQRDSLYQREKEARFLGSNGLPALEQVYRAVTCSSLCAFCFLLW